MIILLLGKLREECAIPTLINLLDDESVRMHAICALGCFKKAEFRCYFERYLNDKNPGCRKYAKTALNKLPMQTTKIETGYVIKSSHPSKGWLDKALYGLYETSA